MDEQLTSLSPSTIRKFWKNLEHERAAKKEQEQGASSVDEQQQLVLNQLKLAAAHGRRSAVFNKIVSVKERKSYFEKLSTEAKGKQLQKSSSDAENDADSKEPVKRLTKSRSSSNITSPRREQGTRLSSEIPRSELATSFEPSKSLQKEPKIIATPREESPSNVEIKTEPQVEDHADVVDAVVRLEATPIVEELPTEVKNEESHMDETAITPVEDKKDESAIIQEPINQPNDSEAAVIQEEQPQTPRITEELKQEETHEEPTQASHQEQSQTPETSIETPSEEQPNPPIEQEVLTNAAPEEQPVQHTEPETILQAVEVVIKESELVSSRDQEEESSTEEEHTDEDKKFILEDDSEEEKKPEREVRFSVRFEEPTDSPSEIVSDFESESDATFDEDTDGMTVEERNTMREDRIAKAQSWNARNDADNAVSKVSTLISKSDFVGAESVTSEAKNEFADNSKLSS